MNPGRPRLYCRAMPAEGPTGGPGARPSGREAAALALLLAATAAAYAPAAGGDFHWDDEVAVLGNARVLDPSRLRAADFLPPALGRDRALTDLSFAAGRALLGPGNAGFVWTNVAVHLAAILLAWAVARAVLRRAGHPRAGPLALAAAALFALHPVQAEAVAFVAQRAESLASALYLAALLAWLSADEAGPGGRRRGLAALGLLLAWAAVAAKGMALTLPLALLLLLVVTPARPLPRGAGRLLLAAPLLAAAALAVSTVRGLGGGAGLDAGDLGPWRYLLTEAWVVVRYLGLVAWPAGLSVDHAVRESPGLSDPVTLACAALLLAALGLGLWMAARAARRPPRPLEGPVAAGLLWFFLVLGPTSSLVPLNDPMAEHRLYLPALGLFLAAVTGGDALLHRLLGPARAPRAGLALAALALAALAVVLAGRARLWRDDLALWTDAARKAPGHFRPHVHAGNAHWRRDEVEPALAAYARAAAVVRPGSAPWPAVQRAYGDALSGAGRHAEALAVLAAAAAAAPDDPSLRESLAWARFTAGDLDGAEAEAAAGRRRWPDSAALAGVAGKAAAQRGDLEAGARELERSVALDPSVPLRWSDLAIVSWFAGRRARACEAMGRFVALEARPALRAEGVRTRAGWGCGP